MDVLKVSAKSNPNSV
ncbi:hypothetical protein, partial [Anaerospora hongkongensis]